MRVPGCLSEAQVETAPRRAADLRDDPVIRLAVLLVLVESHVDERAQRASRLGHAVADGMVDGAFGDVQFLR